MSNIKMSGIFTVKLNNDSPFLHVKLSALCQFTLNQKNS